MIVTCVPANAKKSSRRSQDTFVSNRGNRKIEFVPRIKDTKTVYGEPIPFRVVSNNFPDSVAENTRVYHLDRNSARRSPISSRDPDTHRWYHIIIENANDKLPKREGNFKPTNPRDSHFLRALTNTSVDYDTARASLFQDSSRGLPQRTSRGPYPSFTSNTQLREIIHHKRGRSIDYTVRSPLSQREIPCSEPMPEEPGFRDCAMRQCPRQNTEPSPVLSAWLSALMSESQRI